MSRWFMCTLLIVGCAESSPSGESQALEATVIELVQRAQRGGDDVHVNFVPELSPVGFPLGQESQIEAGSIRGLRMVDGRLLVDVLAQTKSQTYGFTLWLERRADQWLIAGWQPTMARVSAGSVERFRPTDVPVPFAAPSLRRAPKGFVIPRGHKEGLSPQQSQAVHDWLVVRPRIRDVGRSCRDRALINGVLPKIKTAVRRCHEQSLPDRKQARGRIVIAVVGGQVKLSESTIINETLGPCITASVRTNMPKLADCSYTLDLLLMTQR